MKRAVACLTIPVLLAGCGLPPALTLATTVADGVSYAVSGKGMTDHALSAMTSSDCAIVRFLDERDFCTSYAGEESPRVMTASAPEVASWGVVETAALSGSSFAAGGATSNTVQVTAPVEAVQPLQMASFSDAFPALKPASVSITSVTEATRTATVTVLGSFREHANALRAVDTMALLQPRIVAVDSARGTRYRVVSDVAVQQARAAGIADAWPAQERLSGAIHL